MENRCSKARKALRIRCILDPDIHQRSLPVRPGGKALISVTALAGTHIVFWSEDAATVRKDNEADLLAQGQSLAAKDHIYLGMSIAVWSPGRYRPLENKTVLIDPQGRIVFQFLKAHHTPGPEMTMAQISDGKMPVDETAYGRL